MNTFGLGRDDPLACPSMCAIFLVSRRVTSRVLLVAPRGAVHCHVVQQKYCLVDAEWRMEKVLPWLRQRLEVLEHSRALAPACALEVPGSPRPRARVCAALCVVTVALPRPALTRRPSPPPQWRARGP